jgi:sugar lactone lactonase YvrE
MTPVQLVLPALFSTNISVGGRTQGGIVASRWAAALAVAALCLGAYVATARPEPVRAAVASPGTISTYAGNAGNGIATRIPQHPYGLALSGSTLYVADSAGAVVRALDLGTGNETVVAGNGVSNVTSGDGGPATAASIYVPENLAISGRSLYIASNRIRRVDLNTGIITTVAGGGSAPVGDGGPATSVDLHASGVAVDSTGNLIIADSGNNRIRKVDHVTGIITTIAGTGVAGFSGDGGPATSALVSGPSAVAVDGAGGIWIADTQNRRVRKMTGGTINTVAGNGSMTNGSCASGAATATPIDGVGVWVDANGDAIVSGYSCVQQLTGTTLTSIAGGGTSAADGQPPLQTLMYAVQTAMKDGAGNLYISDSGNARLRKVPPGGTVTTIAGTGGPCAFNTSGQATSAFLCDPQGLATDSAGNLFIAEASANVVEEVTPAGTISTVAGNGQHGSAGDGGPATSAQLWNPVAVAVNASGDLLIVDAVNGRIRKVSGGIITTVMSVSNPVAIALDAAGNMLVVDSFDNRVLKVASSGTVSLFAGNGTQGGAGDGGPATSAQLFDPMGVAIDAAGNVYINDMLNQRIRKVDPAGTITSVVVKGHLPQIGPGGQIAITPGGAVVEAGGYNTESVPLYTPNGTIASVAGTGTAGFAGDGGPSTSALLNQPLGVTVDSGGNLYIADSLNHRIRRVEAFGAPAPPTGVAVAAGFDEAVVSWTAPSNSTGLPLIDYAVTRYTGPTPSGPVHVVGSPPATSLVVGALTPGIQYSFKVSASNGWRASTPSAASPAITPLTHPPAGTIVTRAGTVGSGPAQLVAQVPYALALAGTHVYVGDVGNAVLRDLDTISGQESVLAGNGGFGYTGNGGPSVAAMIQGAAAIVNCGPGLTYLADTYNYVIRRIDANGTISSVAGTGQPGYSGDGGSATSARLSRVFGLACRTGGGLYISDSDNGAVRVLDPNGTITTWWAGFSFPTGIVEVGSLNDVAVSDAGADNAVLELTNGPQVFLVAGTPGQAGYGGDNGPAYLAKLSDPRGLAFSPSSGLLIADRGNDRIRQVDSSGRIGTLAGTGVPGFAGDGGYSFAAQLNKPTDVRIYLNQVFVADSENDRVRLIDLTSGGIITTIAGNGTPSRSGDGGPGPQAQVGVPYGVAVDAAGNEYIADDQNAVIRKIDTNGVITTVVGTGFVGFSGDGGPAAGAQLNDPRGVAVNATGDMFISDTGNQRIRRVDHASGVITTVAGTGTAGYSGDNGAATGAMINYPRGIVLDASGSLYIADTGNNRVRKVDTTGVITTLAGNGVAGFAGDGGLAGLAALNGPRGLAIDPAGNLFVTDSNNNRVRTVDHTTSVITTFAGNGIAGLAGDGRAATGAELNFPFGLTFDLAGNLYIADTLNQRIRSVDTHGTIYSVIASCGTVPGWSGDRGPAALAQLNFPYGLGADANGNIFIADANNNRVRVAYGVSATRQSSCPAPPGIPGSRGAATAGGYSQGPRIDQGFQGQGAAFLQPVAGRALTTPMHPAGVVPAQPAPAHALPAQPAQAAPPPPQSSSAAAPPAAAPPAAAPHAAASPAIAPAPPVIAAGQIAARHVPSAAYAALLVPVVLLIAVLLWRRRRAGVRRR